MTRNGKIARLPRALREQINQRLQNGEPGEPLLAWLNPLPEVQTLLQKEFAGIPISKQNLSDWRNGGFVEWELKGEISYDARETIADAVDLANDTDGYLSDHLATILTARYASLVRHWNGEITDDLVAKLKVLHGMIRDVSHLRRWDHSRAKLILTIVKQENLCAETDADWENPQNLAQPGEVPAAVPRLREQNAADSPESSSVKPSQGTGNMVTSGPQASAPDPGSQAPDPSSPSSSVKPSQGTADTATTAPDPQSQTPDPMISPGEISRTAPLRIISHRIKQDVAAMTIPGEPEIPGGMLWGKGLPPDLRPYYPTPCTGNCALTNGICTGCRRTEHEICRWPLLTPENRALIIHPIRQRLAAFNAAHGK